MGPLQTPAIHLDSTDVVGRAYTFFAIFCLLSLIWTFYFVPETKGRTLEAMDQYVCLEFIFPPLDDDLNFETGLTVVQSLDTLEDLTCPYK